MGEIVIKKWQCDCCRQIFDQKPPLGFPRHRVTFTAEHEWHADHVAWKEICPECNKLMAIAIDQFQATMREKRTKKS